MELTYDNIKQWYTNNKYQFYTRPFEINILGIRNDYQATDLWDDKCIITYNDGRNDKILVFNQYTTDPGFYFLKTKLLNPKGCFFLKEGQHKNMWTQGLHTGKYKALIQYAPCVGYRDKNGNNTLDTIVEDKGNFGIDFHHGYNSYIVHNNSAGCQVLKNIKDLEQLLPLFELHERTYGKGINYTLTNKLV